jgi:tetrapyrrole methylase family protein/MazG family protein
VDGAAQSFERFFEIVKRLRSPDGGCPWDLEQTPQSLLGSLIEEAYECVEAVGEGDTGHIREELGDLFLVVCMISYMHEQAGLFAVADVLDSLSEKLVRRHPHVFGGETARDSDEVLRNWARIKVEVEGRKPKASALDSVSRALPPLERAFRLQKKAAKFGFDWADTEGVFAKTEEELGEARAASSEAARLRTPDSLRDLEAELGDLLFSAVNLCRFLDVDPSAALQGANAKFARRFEYVENGMKRAEEPMNAANIALMDKFWEAAKTAEKTPKTGGMEING